MDTAFSLGSPANFSCTVKATGISQHDDVFVQGKLVFGTEQTEMTFTQELNPFTTTYTFNHIIKMVAISDGGIYHCTAALIYKGSNDFVLNSNTTSSSSLLYIASKLCKFKLVLPNICMKYLLHLLLCAIYSVACLYSRFFFIISESVF